MGASPTHPIEMREIVLNTRYGGFDLSSQVISLFMEATKDVERSKYFYIDQDVERDDPILIRIMKDVGLAKSGGQFGKLAIIEIPDDVAWIIQDYDGMEWVAEKHRTWRYY
jgi:hypothetical protein